MKYLICILTFAVCTVYGAEQQLFLRENLEKTRVGDYLVTQQNKNTTVLLIKERNGEMITLEEVTVPSKRYKASNWKEWVTQGAPGNTCWVMYTMHIPTGQMVSYYSYTQQQWFDMSGANNFLSQILNLQLSYVQPSERKKVGPPQARSRRNWNPKLIFEGSVVPDVPFHAYRTRWPKDNTELSDRLIIAYLPVDSETYPSYFPYWLHITGAIGKAKLRIVDSGRGLTSPMKVDR